MKEVIDPPVAPVPGKIKNPVFTEHIFDLSMMEAYENLSNFELKKTGIKA
jgi:hypothetical protein